MKKACHHSEIENLINTETKKWLVTGAAGFIGSHLCETLLASNQEVIGYDNLSTGLKSNINHLNKLKSGKFSFIEADLLETKSLEEALIGVDYVLHQGALGSVPRSIEFPIDTFNANVVAFHNLLISCKNIGIKRIVYASSSSVYGNTKSSPKKEGIEGELLSPYALSKKSNEDYAHMYAKTYGLQLVGLRYFNVFGPRQNPEGAYAAVIPRWINAAITGEEINIFGDGLNSRDFCYISNVVYANLLAATKKIDKSISYSNVFNVACGESANLNQLFEQIKIELEVSKFSKIPSKPNYLAPRKGDVKSSLGDINSISKELGYTPLVKFNEGLKKTVESFVIKNQ